jgi:hypothetical protein
VRHEASVLGVGPDRRGVELGASEPGTQVVTSFRPARAALIVAAVLASTVGRPSVLADRCDDGDAISRVDARCVGRRPGDMTLV